jgi:ectoine hydroxylase-related dioxygenase (phytanoyl-CoA dioxygenase family)
MPPALHVWNHGFQWQDHPGPFALVSPEQARAFDERGFFVLEDAFEAETLARVTREIDPVEARVTEFLRTQEGGRLFIADARAITFCTHLVARSPLLRAFCSGPVFQGLARDLVGPDVRLYWDQAVYKKPGAARAFPWHQDNGYTFVEPQQYLTCWVALDDATPENGCPRVVPGLHRLGTLAHRLTDAGWQCLDEPDDAVPVPARAGSIVVFSSLTPHATGPNRTGSVRKAYIVQFAPSGARALHQAPGAGAPVAVTQDAPDRQFELLRGGLPVA